MSMLAKIKEFFFGPAVSVSGKHPLDGPTKRAIIEQVPAPAPAPAEPVAEVKVEVPVPVPAPAPEKSFIITPTEWPFPTGEKPVETLTVPADSTSNIKVETVKKPRKPRTPKVQNVKVATFVAAKVAPPPVAAPAIKAKPKVKGKKK